MIARRASVFDILVFPIFSHFQADTAVFNLGNVSNTNTSTDEQDSRIVITFSVTLKEAISLVPDDRYWVTAGVEYNGEAKLWVGQIGFLLDPGPQVKTNNVHKIF